MGFDFERMTIAFEAIQEDYSTLCQKSPQSIPQLPSTARFLEAMGEVLSLFETLGSAFTFAKRDIGQKIAIISRYNSLDPAHFSNLNHAVQYETEQGTLEERNVEGMQSFSRTVLRLMWALKFADCLLEGLALAFDSRSGLREYERTLKWAVGRAYDEALAEHHSWTIRRSVKGACMLLPSKESFIGRLGVQVERRDEFLKRLGVSMSPLVERMYSYYEKYDLLRLP